ncbi:MAG TPA: hypothetical protein VNL18_12530 [Gemmatimonadales bacterium]|nr:hypothetical protein [Gemmatimonadales bacterium]
MKAHRLMKDEGMPDLPPTHEEKGHTYSLLYRPEVKSGAQVPASFRKFLASEWFRKALSQSERAVPVGSGAKPAVFMDMGREGRWLVVRMQEAR